MKKKRKKKKKKEDEQNQNFHICFLDFAKGERSF